MFHFVQGLSGGWYLICLFFIAFILDIFTVLYYRCLSLGLISRTVALSVMINAIAVGLCATVVLSNGWGPFIVDCSGVGVGTYVAMKLKLKAK